MISEYYSDDELISQLREFFDVEERMNIDFKSFLGLITEYDEFTFEVKINGRVFHFDKELCSVEEVE